MLGITSLPEPDDLDSATDFLGRKRDARILVSIAAGIDQNLMPSPAQIFSQIRQDLRNGRRVRVINLGDEKYAGQ
jgi:hypothetical protein